MGVDWDRSSDTRGAARGLLRFAPLPAIALAALIALVALLSVSLSPRNAAALDGEESAFLTMINNYRAQNGLGALSTNDKLRNAALWMAQDMAAKNYFSHTDSLGRDPFARMADFGYTYNTWKGENLAAGVAGAAGAMDLWKGSPGHNQNMLNPDFTVIGIARANNPNSSFGWYWVTDFGGQGDPGPAPAPPPAPATPPPPPPATPAPPPVTPAPTPVPATPTPVPATPTPSPKPTPVPEPHTVVLLRSPSWWQIALEVKPWWDHLTVVGYDQTIGNGDSILTGASRMAEKFFEITGNRFAAPNFVRSGDDSDTNTSLSLTIN